jgi:hypothetical protein
MVATAAMQAYQANEANDKSKVQNSIRKVEAELANKVRDSKNSVAAQVDKLQRWVQASNNKLRMQAAASAIEANTVNASRRGSERMRQKFSSSVQRAEVMGQQAAATGLSGVAGPVTDIVAGTLALRDSIVTENLRRQGLSEDFDTARRAGALMSQMVNGLDNSILHPSIDYNQATPNLLHEKSGNEMFAPILANLGVEYLKQEPPKILVKDTPSGTPDRVPEQFRFETSIAPGADDPFSLWVRG